LRINVAITTDELLTNFGLAHTADGWRDQLAQLEAGGSTEVAFQPAGPDIPGEHKAFAEAFARSTA
jgi:5,10-methylenetetrahydromethanopterin reductase